VHDEGLQPLLRLAARHPLLEADEELALIARAQAGDEKATERLVLAHLKLAISLSRPFARTSAAIQLSDLVQEASLGLLVAIRKFSAERGCRLSTVARPWIRARLSDHVRKRSIVKLPESAELRRTFWNLARVRAQVGALERYMTDQEAEEVARRLQVTRADVRSIEALASDQSLDAPVRVADDSEAMFELVDQLVDDRPDPETALADADERQWRQGVLRDALCKLNPRERQIVEARYLAERPVPQEALAAQLGCTKQRVSQLQIAAVGRLRALVRELGNHGTRSSERGGARPETGQLP
jgi:RNA polymerase sigma-32 factor